MPALSVNSVSFRYDPDTPLIHDCTLSFRPGEFFSLAGPNGSGKSTLLRLLDRILLPQGGTIMLDDRNIQKYARAELARTIAFVPQDGGPLFPFTVEEVVLMGRSPHIRGLAFENVHDREIAREMMSLLDIVHLSRQPINALSGGERQRAFIARALAQQPRIILLDEPNAHLDIAHQLDVFGIIKRLNREAGLSVISVSHDLNLAAGFSDRIALMVHGALAAVGTPAEVVTEERIREVFRADVLVDRHPVDRTPRITLVTGK
jgi:iron complex transport system ATP-binding protein